MELRTHVWGAAWTAVVVVVLAVGAVAWLRPLPNRAADAAAGLGEAWLAFKDGKQTTDAMVTDLVRFAHAGPGFGESRHDGTLEDDPYDAVRSAAIARLGQVEPDAAFHALCELAVADDRQVSLYAVEALRARGDRRAMPTFFHVLAIDDQRQRRINDDYARLTNETLRAIRDMADRQTKQELRQFADAGRRAFDPDIRRTINLIAQDQDTLTRLPATGMNGAISTPQDNDTLFAPDPTRLGTQILLTTPGSPHSTTPPRAD